MIRSWRRLFQYPDLSLAMLWLMIHSDSDKRRISIAFTPGSGMYPRYVQQALPEVSAARNLDVAYCAIVRGRLVVVTLSSESCQSVKKR